jgi:hypothetical protein
MISWLHPTQRIPNMNIGFHPLLGAAAIACNPKDYAAVCVTLNHVSLSFSALCNEVVYRIVGRDGRAMDRRAASYRVSIYSSELTTTTISVDGSLGQRELSVDELCSGRCLGDTDISRSTLRGLDHRKSSPQPMIPDKLPPTHTFHHFLRTQVSNFAAATQPDPMTICHSARSS